MSTFDAEDADAEYYEAIKGEDEVSVTKKADKKESEIHQHGQVMYKLPLFLLNEFYRLASAINMDQSDVQLLFNNDNDDENTQGNPDSDYTYFFNEVIRKIERMEHEGNNHGNRYLQNDEDYLNEEKAKKQQMIKKQEKILNSKTSKFQENVNSELQKVLSAQVNDMEALNKSEKKKSNEFNRLLQKYYREKKQNKIYEDFVQTQNKKIDILAEHIEKLMKTLKIESSKRMKALDDLNNTKKEETGMHDKIVKMQRMHGAQEK